MHIVIKERAAVKLFVAVFSPTLCAFYPEEK